MMKLPSFIRENVSLAERSTFRIGGAARYFAQPSNRRELELTLSLAGEMGVGIRVLGGGSNLLVADGGVPAMVVQLAVDGDFAGIARSGEKAGRWKVGTAVPLAKLVRQTVEHGYAGLEYLAGIPGSVGGAVAMNCGSGNRSVGQLVACVEAYAANGDRRRLTGADLGFAYRKSGLGNLIAVEVGFAFPETAEPAMLLNRLGEFRARKKASQPLGFPSAGCVFKNPDGDSAGALLDLAGCKGMSEGKAAVSALHANFIINQGGATAGDVARLARRMREAVLEKSGVALELEVVLWGDDREFAPLRATNGEGGMDVDKR